MKLLSNVHTHCDFCDGADPPEKVITAAIGLGFTDLGFSCHSPAPFDPVCPGVSSEKEYRSRIAHLHDDYKDTLHILCGIEADTYAPVDNDDYDYVITSNHFLPAVDGRYVAVDGDPEKLQAALNKRYNGDAAAMLRDYFNLQIQGIRQQQPDIAGHFDLYKKYNRDGRFFNEDSPAYRSLAKQALDDVLRALDSYGGMLEVNTGAMARGLRDDPYPSLDLLKHAAQKNARVIITSDSHRAETLNAYFGEAQELLRLAGFRWMVVLQNGQFRQVKIEQ